MAPPLPWEPRWLLTRCLPRPRSHLSPTSCSCRPVPPGPLPRRSLPAPGCPVLIVSPTDCASLSVLGPRVQAAEGARGPSRGGSAHALCCPRALPGGRGGTRGTKGAEEQKEQVGNRESTGLLNRDDVRFGHHPRLKVGKLRPRAGQSSPQSCCPSPSPYHTDSNSYMFLLCCFYYGPRLGLVSTSSPLNSHGSPVTAVPTSS